MTGTVEYVGESTNPKERYRMHTRSKPSETQRSGKFYGRQDIIMNIVTEFNSKKEAFDYQCQLQKEYGLISDSEKLSNAHRNRELISDITKLKMSLSKKGKPRPQWVKDKIRATQIQNRLTIMTLCSVKD
jgi:hypothetical protein